MTDLDQARRAAREAAEMAAKATPGPWRVDESGDRERFVVESIHYEDETPGVCGDHSTPWRLIEEDADFIAAARTAVPALAGYVEKLCEEVERAELIGALALCDVLQVTHPHLAASHPESLNDPETADSFRAVVQELRARLGSEKDDGG